jgi:Rod binding domain-containing protein
MPGVNPTDVLGTGELNPPPGVELRTQEQKDLYRASMEFERFFLQHMVKQMNAATKAMQTEGSESSGSTSAYQDMAQDSMVQGMLDGGGLGIAATLYEQMADASGILDDGKPAEDSAAAPAGGAA